MSQIETAIVSLLSDAPTVASLVVKRIFPNVLPQGEILPAIVYQQISGPRDYTSDGPSGLVFSRYQINSIAETYAAAKELFEAVRLTVSGYEGTVNGVEIQGIELENEADFPDVKPEGEKKVIYGKHCDLVIYYQETIV